MSVQNRSTTTNQLKALDIPFIDLGKAFAEQEQALTQAFLQVGRSGQYILGEQVEKLESQLAQYCDSCYAIGVGNGTDALALILKVLGIGPGDEVISPTNTFIGTVGAIHQVGATARLIDVGEDYNLDPDLLDQVKTKKTRAIIAVHLTGNPAAMQCITQWASQHGVDVIEDAAQAIGARHQSRAVGSLAKAAAFSLHPLKILGGFGDGGFITTDCKKMYGTLLRLRNHGLKNRDEAIVLGSNSRLDALQAALLEVKLKKLPETIAKHQHIATTYRMQLAHLAHTQRLKLPLVKAADEAVYHNFIIRTPLRDALKDFLHTKGIETKIHYPIPIHQMQCMQGQVDFKISLPNAEQQSKEILSLPIYPELLPEQIHRVCQGIDEFFKTYALEAPYRGTSHRSTQALSSH